MPASFSEKKYAKPAILQYSLSQTTQPIKIQEEYKVRKDHVIPDFQPIDHLKIWKSRNPLEKNSPKVPINTISNQQSRTTQKEETLSLAEQDHARRFTEAAEVFFFSHINRFFSSERRTPFWNFVEWVGFLKLTHPLLWQRLEPQRKGTSN